jgi:ParB family chromosome partitioning protein
VARANFLSDQGDLDSAALRLPSDQKAQQTGFPAEIDAAMEAMKSVPWTVLQELKGDPAMLKKLDDAEALLRALKKALS